jgi:hypothetical protein
MWLLSLRIVPMRQRSWEEEKNAAFSFARRGPEGALLNSGGVGASGGLPSF